MSRFLKTADFVEKIGVLKSLLLFLHETQEQDKSGWSENPTQHIDSWGKVRSALVSMHLKKLILVIAPESNLVIFKWVMMRKGGENIYITIYYVYCKI